MFLRLTKGIFIHPDLIGMVVPAKVGDTEYTNIIFRHPLQMEKDEDEEESSEPSTLKSFRIPTEHAGEFLETLECIAISSDDVEYEENQEFYDEQVKFLFQDDD